MKKENDLKKIMRSHKEQTKCMGLPIFLGYDDNNQPLIVDLAEVGNILVGGASGQGKTNLLHAFAKSCFYAPPKVSQGCIVYYIDSKGVEEFSPYFAIQLNEADEIRKELEMLCDKISKRESDKKISRYPIAVLIDDVDHLLLMDKNLAESVEFIAAQGPRVGIYMVLTTARTERKIISERLLLEMPCRISFRHAEDNTTVLLAPHDASRPSRCGEALFYHDGTTCHLQTINVTW